MNKFWNIWNANGEVKLGNYTLQGFSVAGYRTNFYIKELGIMLDAGISAPFNATHIFVTHSHADHIANLPFHLMGKIRTRRTIYCPKSSVKCIDSYIRSLYTATSGGIDTWQRRNHITIGVKNYDFLDMTIKNKNYVVEVIKCHHSVDSVGYGFISTKKKLKKELKKLKGNELKKLTDKEKYNFVSTFEFCYIGDTSCDVLEDEALERYKSVIIECSFIHEDELDRSTLTKHIHWQQLKPFILNHPKIIFYLYHFSARYEPEQIVDFFKYENIPNIVVLANNHKDELAANNVEENNQISI